MCQYNYYLSTVYINTLRQPVTNLTIADKLLTLYLTSLYSEFTKIKYKIIIQ